MVFDVAVIGGGILGRAITFQLSQSGMTTACIYQRNHFRAQASAAAGGMLGVFSEVSAHDLPERQQLEVAQRQLARGLYDNFVADLCQRSGIAVQLTGGLFVIANSAGEDDALELAAIREAALAFGSRAETVSPRDVPGVAPQTGTVAYEALFLPDEG